MVVQSWIGKARFLLEGVVYEYEGGTEAEYAKIKNVPEDKIVARFEGSWRGKITWRKTRGPDTVGLDPFAQRHSDSTGFSYSHRKL
jgi:hypothetical protein